MKIGEVFKPANGGIHYAKITDFPERTVSNVTGKPLKRPVEDVSFQMRKNNMGRWGSRIYRLSKKQFGLEFVAMMLMLALLPGAAFAQLLGYSQPNAMGGYNYYSVPNAGHDNAMATQNFLGAMRMIQQQRQFNRQMEMMQMELDRKDAELQRQRLSQPRISKLERLEAPAEPRWKQAQPIKIELRNKYGKITAEE